MANKELSSSIWWLIPSITPLWYLESDWISSRGVGEVVCGTNIEWFDWPACLIWWSTHDIIVIISHNCRWWALSKPGRVVFNCFCCRGEQFWGPIWSGNATIIEYFPRVVFCLCNSHLLAISGIFTRRKRAENVCRGFWKNRKRIYRDSIMIGIYFQFHSIAKSLPDNESLNRSVINWI